MPAVVEALQTALKHHCCGDLERAEAACREALRVDPRHAEALHLLGIVAFQRKESVTAIDLIGQAIDIDRNCPVYHNSLGNVYRFLGRPMDAIAAIREAIRLKPDFSAAFNNLGIVLGDCKQDEGARACFQQALRLDEANAHAWVNLGRALLKSGERIQAATCFERAIAFDPDHAEGHAHLGACRSAAGRFGDAVTAYERAVRLGHETQSLLKDLAASYLQLGRSGDAERAYRRGVTRWPNDPQLVLNLAQALKDQRKLEEAVHWYRRGLALEPRNASAHYALGQALHLDDRFSEAIASYRASLDLGSRDARAAYHLGNAYKSLKRLSEAVDSYLKALEWDPHLVSAIYQLGNAYRQANDLDGARMCLEEVLERKPGDLPTLVSLGNVLKAQDDLPAAATVFRQVISRLPGDPLWELWLDTLCPTVFHSSVGIDQFRSKLLQKLRAFAERPLRLEPADITKRGCPPPYNLQFHGRDDRPIKEAYAAVFRNLAETRASDSSASAIAEHKPRIGFVVTDGHEGVFLRYLQGVIERLDRRQFDPVIICSAAGELRIRTQLPAETAETFVIPSRFDQLVERVAAGHFAVLYYWEIGSDTTNYFLPFFGLAPIQCTGAGLPVTSGIPQVNYFLTNDICEPPRAERVYTERLIRARSLLTWQRRVLLPRAPRSRAQFGFDENQHVYLCANKIEKFHPDFDGLLGDILRQDPEGLLVIPKDRNGYASRKLQNRMQLALPHVRDRIRFVSYQSFDGYLSLVHAADVLLDPIHYGGGLTSLDGFALGKPIVTLPGEFVRGRYTLGFYRTMQMEDCIAATGEDYIQKATKLGTDADWRAHLVDRLCERNESLFESNAAVTEYNQIFDRLVEEALRGGNSRRLNETDAGTR